MKWDRRKIEEEAKDENWKWSDKSKNVMPIAIHLKLLFEKRLYEKLVQCLNVTENEMKNLSEMYLKWSFPVQIEFVGFMFPCSFSVFWWKTEKISFLPLYNFGMDFSNEKEKSFYRFHFIWAHEY